MNMPFEFLLRVRFYGRDHRGSPILLPIPYRILCLSRGGMEEPDHRQCRLLRPRRERPRDRAAEQRDELAPFHSITSSARPERGSGTVMPSAFAVLRLITSSKRVGCSIRQFIYARHSIERPASGTLAAPRKDFLRANLLDEVLT